MGVPRGVPGYLLVVYQVGPVPFRHGVLGIGNQECARLAELVGVPAGFECALSQDQIHVAAFPHAQAYPGIHLRADRAFTHGILARPLRCREQGDRYGPAQPGHGIGIGMSLLGHLGVFVDHDHQRRIIRRRAPRIVCRFRPSVRRGGSFR